MACVILAALAIVLVQNAGKADESVLPQYVEKLHSTNSIERNGAIHAVQRQDSNAIKYLIDILSGDSPIEVKVDAARMLGRYRSHDCVKALIDNLELEKQDRQLLTGLVTDEEYASLLRPISTALEQIGSFAIPQLIQAIATNDNIQARGQVLTVLTHIDGDKDIVELRLQKALKAEKDSQKQARLKDALKALSAISI